MPMSRHQRHYTASGNGQSSFASRIAALASGSATDSRDRRVSRGSQGARPAPDAGPIAAAEAYLNAYMVLPERSALVIAAWVQAAWLAEVWDRFAHLAITS